MPGYLPRIPTPAHPALIEAIRTALPGRELKITELSRHGGGSTDVGDVQHIQPVLSFTTGGSKGAYHSPAFELVDEEEAYIGTAKVFALAAYRLLKDHAAEAKKVIEDYKPVFTKESYIEFMESLIRKERKELTGNE
jgi:hypothetical protein